MTKYALFKYKTPDVSFNGIYFSAFINEIILNFEEQEMHEMIFIVDSIELKKDDYCRRKNIKRRLYYSFLPPYSPQLNIIKEVFSQWKNCIKIYNCNNPI